ncbi:hypothetical protein PFICI_04980 [Pestalotiopsis fici W106-1]|uniref:Rhodopsin domain-containing protein n=1 Tax=Pestalotiopsis fici (strain W106-1 / CGMCC3.15140) TaxID=1229662 RepID=W3XAN8_PESFW|nr:uncharacterized protein PFICI_04980 [Pestalotiopsis fici W106-1]ETS83104.1 hypothetical protein PFICI_04980 [Pestalotiopsis fici W106-1]
MLPSRIWLGPAALMAAVGAAAQNTTANSSSSSATSLTPVVVLMEFPSCASAQCSLTDMASLLNCFCTNVTAQAELSTCAQLSCEIYDAGTSLYIENAMCAAYPKQSLVYVINTAAIVTFALAIPVVAARCAARWRLTKGLWSDDYMSIAATVFLIVLGVIQLECGKVGFGLHIWNFDWNNSEKLLILDYVGQIAYIWVQITSKLAVLLLYYRVFKVAGSLWFRWAVRGCMAFKLLHGLIYTFVVIFQCSPVSAFWDTTITDAKCFNEGIIVFSGAVVSIAEDIALMVLPISELRKLQVSGRKRWGVAIMFAFASFGTIASIVRLRYLLVLDESHDSTWNNVNIVVWSLIENLMAVVCGSLPALRPYVDPWIPRISVTWPKSRGSSKGTPKHTDNSTANSDTLYSPSTYGADYKKYSYPMPPRSPHNSYGRWKESHPVEEEDEEDQHQLDDLEVGLASVMVVSRKTPDLLERGRKSPDAIEQGQSSESETELIIQGNRASAAYSQNQRSSTGAKQN